MKERINGKQKLMKLTFTAELLRGCFAQPLFFTLICKLLMKRRKSNEQTGTHSANGIAVGG